VPGARFFVSLKKLLQGPMKRRPLTDRRGAAAQGPAQLGRFWLAVVPIPSDTSLLLRTAKESGYNQSLSWPRTPVYRPHVHHTMGQGMRTARSPVPPVQNNNTTSEPRKPRFRFFPEQCQSSEGIRMDAIFRLSARNFNGPSMTLRDADKPARETGRLDGAREDSRAAPCGDQYPGRMTN